MAKKKLYTVKNGLEVVGLDLPAVKRGKAAAWLGEYSWARKLRVILYYNDLRQLRYAYELEAFEAYKNYLEETRRKYG